MSTGARPDLGSARVDTVAVPLMATKFWEGYAEISPNGRWMAYVSNESGHSDVYVVPFPNTRAAKWAVSTQYGLLPRWSHSGKELFYRDSAANLVSVEVTITRLLSGPSEGDPHINVHFSRLWGCS